MLPQAEDSAAWTPQIPGGEPWPPEPWQPDGTGQRQSWRYDPGGESRPSQSEHPWAGRPLADPERAPRSFETPADPDRPWAEPPPEPDDRPRAFEQPADPERPWAESTTDTVDRPWPAAPEQPRAFEQPADPERPWAEPPPEPEDRPWPAPAEPAAFEQPADPERPWAESTTETAERTWGADRPRTLEQPAEAERTRSEQPAERPRETRSGEQPVERPWAEQPDERPWAARPDENLWAEQPPAAPQQWSPPPADPERPWAEQPAEQAWGAQPAQQPWNAEQERPWAEQAQPWNGRPPETAWDGGGGQQPPPRRTDNEQWLPDDGPRWRGPVIAGVVAALLTALIVVGYVFWSKSDDGGDLAVPQTTSQPKSKTTPKTSDAPKTEDDPAEEPSGDAKSQATAVDGVLSDMTASRKKLESISYTCSAKNADISTFKTAVSEREGQLADVDDLKFDALDGGDDLKASLKEALQASIDANGEAIKFLRDEDGCDGDAATRLQDWNDKAGAAKTKFLEKWNAIAKDLGLDSRKREEI